MGKAKESNQNNSPYMDFLLHIVADEKNGLDVAVNRELDDVLTEKDAMLFFVKYHGKLKTYTALKLRLTNRP